MIYAITLSIVETIDKPQTPEKMAMSTINLYSNLTMSQLSKITTSIVISS